MLHRCVTETAAGILSDPCCGSGWRYVSVAEVAHPVLFMESNSPPSAVRVAESPGEESARIRKEEDTAPSSMPAVGVDASSTEPGGRPEETSQVENSPERPATRDDSKIILVE